MSILIALERVDFFGMSVAEESDMIKHYSQPNFTFCLCTLALILASHFGVASLSQETRSKDEAEIRTLIKKSRDKELKISDQANQALSKLDSQSIPTLLKILKKGNPCERADAARIIIDLDKRNKEIVPQLVDIARGASIRTFFHPQEELICRRGAAFLLGLSPEGIRELIKMLKEGDQFERHSAIFAFDELTETTDYPKEILPEMREAIPLIAASGKTKDEVMQNMSNEVLWQIVRHSPPELTEIAKKFVNENQK